MDSIREKRGSYILEAAIVLPMIILSLITVTMIVMFFYMVSVSRCDMHQALRCKSGTLTSSARYDSENGREVTAEDLWSGEIHVSGKSILAKVQGSTHIRVGEKGLLKSWMESDLEGTCTAKGGVDYIWYCSALKGGVRKKDESAGK